MSRKGEGERERERERCQRGETGVYGCWPEVAAQKKEGQGRKKNEKNKSREREGEREWEERERETDGQTGRRVEYTAVNQEL